MKSTILTNLQIVFLLGPGPFDKVGLEVILPPGAALNIGAPWQLLGNLVPPDRLRNYFIDHVTHKAARACSRVSVALQATVYCYIIFACGALRGAANSQKKRGKYKSTPAERDISSDDLFDSK